MSFPTLAEHVVEILAQRARMTIDAPHHRAADTLFDAVIGRLRRTGTAGTFDLFAADPDAPARRRPLIGVLNHQFRDDPQFRELIAEMVRATNIALPTNGEPRPEPSGFNGKLVAIVLASLLAVAGLAVGGRALYVELTEEPPPDPNTSCRDFFAMHPDKQRGLLEHIYRQRNEPLRERDPYIVASVLYGCGQNPDRTVIEVVNATA